MAGRVADSVWVERQEWILRQKESGSSVAQFCRDHGLHEGNFHAWRQRFARLNGQQPIVAGKAAGRCQALHAFVQLPAAASNAAVGSTPSWIEVTLAEGMLVRVPNSNLAALEAVLDGLSRWRQESRHA